MGLNQKLEGGRSPVLDMWRSNACVLLLTWMLFGFVRVGSGESAVSHRNKATNTLQLRHLASQQEITNCYIELEGVVLWVSPNRDQFAIQDDSGGVLLKMDLRFLNSPITPGQRVRIEADWYAGQGEIASTMAVVDSDGLHALREKTGKIFLAAGLHPIRVEWFNGLGLFGLTAGYQGPVTERREIPADALFRRINDTGQLTNGLDYCVYEGIWSRLPDFSRLPALRTGTVSNFDIAVRTRDENVGVVFTGYLKVPASGNYSFWTKSDDGSKLYIGDWSGGLKVLGMSSLPEPQQIFPGQRVEERQEGSWSEMEGTVTAVRGPTKSPNIEVNSGTGRAYLKVIECDAPSLDFLLRHRVKITGIYQSALSVDGQTVPTLLVPNSDNITVLDPPPNPSSVENSTNLPLLTTVLQVMNLGRTESLRGYPVRLEGVVTAHFDRNFFIQDATWSIYVSGLNTGGGRLPKVGEFWRIEGVSSAGFAPDIVAKRATYLGPGVMPTPVRPTRDELINGSLGIRYMEIQGVVCGVRSNEMSLLTRSGKIRINCLDLATNQLAGLEDALVRISGVGSSERDSHDKMLQGMRLYNASVKVDEPAPADPFATPLKRANDLYFFDARADRLQRVRIAGQIVREYHGEFFLMDGQHGFRFRPKTTLQFQVGTRVQVVGFPDRNGPSPVLLEAVARRTGKAELPAPTQLLEKDMLDPNLDATLVRTQSRLVGLTLDGTEQAFELQLGNRSYLARLQRGSGLLPELEPGSELQLTGVYVGQRVDRTLSRDIDSFELLLNSPADVVVLARPSWWTVRHAAMVMGAMLTFLAAAMVWITLLHRQVEDRSLRLTAEIKSREQAEHQRVLEEERARIAQDLHDDLGSGITEMSMLVSLMKTADASSKKRERYLDQVHAKAQEMVTALDEIVWAMNPRHNLVGSLVSYFSLYADRFLGLAGISWRLEKPLAPLDRVVDARHRHQLFLAFKEALTNIVRHSQASEVRLSIQIQHEQLCLAVADNGSGFSSQMPVEDMNGLLNMRTRIEKLGGKFQLDTRPGGGTTVRFFLPLNT